MAGIVAIVLVTAWVTVMLLGEEMPEREFRRLSDRSEAASPEQPLSELDDDIEATEIAEPFATLADPELPARLGREAATQTAASSGGGSNEGL